MKSLSLFVPSLLLLVGLVSSKKHVEEVECLADGTCQAQVEHHDDQGPSENSHPLYADEQDAIERKAYKPKNHYEAKEHNDDYLRENDLDGEMGLAQNLVEGHKQEIEKLLDEALEYWTNIDSSLQKQCKNFNSFCAYWAVLGECETNPEYMIQKCGPVCQACGGDAEEEEYDSLGVIQKFDETNFDSVKQVLEKAHRYMTQVVAKDEFLQESLDACKNRDPKCAQWAASGECQGKHEEYMKINCGPVCQSCEMTTTETRCPIDPETMPDVWKAGDLNEMFVNLTTLAEYQQYEPRILSRPDYEPGHDENTGNLPYQLGPWVVVMDKFLSEEECAKLIELGHTEGYKRSKDVGELNPDGSHKRKVSTGRTSANAWCQNECFEDPVALQIVDRIANVTNTPANNSEYLQLLRYGVGERYKVHHDFIKFEPTRQQGPRILTVFMYLNDVEAGGGTSFPRLDLTLQPKRGSALIWPSVKNEDPSVKDVRTEHEALAVEAGEKYGANAWIHLRDFKTPNVNRCQ